MDGLKSLSSQQLDAWGIINERIKKWMIELIINE